jgi:hypothetical protein
LKPLFLPLFTTPTASTDTLCTQEKKEKSADDGVPGSSSRYISSLNVASAASTSSRAAVVNTAEVEALKSRLAETRMRLEQVMAEGNAMQQQLQAREQDTFEVVSFLRAENDTLQERLKHYEGE